MAARRLFSSTSSISAAVTAGPIVVPHPSLAPGLLKKVSVKTSLPTHTLAQTLAVVRQVESRIGQVVAIHQPKYPDMGVGRNVINLTLLSPYEQQGDAEGETRFEVDVPAESSERSTRHYGPSLQTIQEILELKDSAQETTEDEKFTVSLRFHPQDDVVNESKESPRATQARRDNRLESRRTYWAELAVEAEREVGLALANGFKGFYGGFEELGKLFVDAKEEMLQRQAEQEKVTRAQPQRPTRPPVQRPTRQFRQPSSPRTPESPANAEANKPTKRIKPLMSSAARLGKLIAARQAKLAAAGDSKPAESSDASVSYKAYQEAQRAKQQQPGTSVGSDGSKQSSESSGFMTRMFGK